MAKKTLLVEGNNKIPLLEKGATLEDINNYIKAMMFSTVSNKYICVYPEELVALVQHLTGGESYDEIFPGPIGTEIMWAVSGTFGYAGLTDFLDADTRAKETVSKYKKSVVVVPNSIIDPTFVLLFIQIGN